MLQYNYPQVKPIADSGNRVEEWHVLKTKPRNEILVNVTLCEAGVKVYLPKLLTLKKSEQAPVFVPLFPGYLFFQLSLASQLWTFSNWAPGVSYVLKDFEGPLVISEALIQEIRLREKYQHEHFLEKNMRPFERNEMLKVVSGPMCGLDAVFECTLSASGRVQILVEILGRLTRVNLNVDQVGRLS
jgi:transcriptional antiterminator RfaH